MLYLVHSMKWLHMLKNWKRLNQSLFILFMIILSTGLSFANPSEKYALVIGNSTYKDGKLKNPAHDASLMAKTLKKVGFKLIGNRAHTNLNRQQMQLKIIDFGDQLKISKGVGLFYFAGHGVQIGGVNYLIPIGADMTREAFVKVYGVPVDAVLSQMEVAQNKLNLMVLDACRNNPFASSYRSATRGLKVQNAPSGTLILYATRPGEVSLDGVGYNSPFTKALTKNMKKEGLKIEEVIRETSKEVEKYTNGNQTPWQEGFVREQFYFVKPTVKKKVCPKGSKLVHKKCVIQKVTCPSGSVMQNNQCIASLNCPKGSIERNGQCVAQIRCPKGSYFKKESGCVFDNASTTSPITSTHTHRSQKKPIENIMDSLVSSSPRNKNPSLSIDSVSPPPSYLKSIPSFTWWGLGLGVIGHIANFTNASTTILNMSFASTLIGYTSTGIGLGAGIYYYGQSAKKFKNRSLSTIQLTYEAMKRSTLETTLPPIQTIQFWKGTF